VERARTARRFISKTKPPYSISDLEIIELNKNEGPISDGILNLFREQVSFGLISESGMPAVADPGSEIVRLAHQHGFQVRPLVGPSSILLALAASGLNGQGFSFRGYLPIKDNELSTALKEIEKIILKKRVTQIFIETPYRNQRLFQTILKHCHNQLLLCVAIDITGPEEKIVTKTISEWRKSKFQLSKVPTIFLLG